MNLLNNVNNEPSNFWDYLIGFPGLVILLTLIGLIIGSYLSFDNDKKSGKMRKGVDDINAIVITTENKLNEASTNLESNIDIAKLNLDKVTLANVQLLETNEKLNKASLQLLDNYNKTLEALEASNKAKDEALLAKNETIKSKDEIIGQLTGGNSFPRISLKKGGFHISVQGVYSLYDVKVTIRLIPNFLKIPKQTTQDYLKGLQPDSKYIITFNQFTFPKLLSGSLPGSINIKDFNSYFTRNEEDMHAIDIFIESDRKIWFQRTRLVTHNGKWEVADILKEIPSVQKDNSFNDGTPIFNTVSEKFPLYYPNNENWKLIILYNAGEYEINKKAYDFIEYKNGNGMSDFSFDEL